MAGSKSKILMDRISIQCPSISQPVVNRITGHAIIQNVNQRMCFTDVTPLIPPKLNATKDFEMWLTVCRRGLITQFDISKQYITILISQASNLRNGDRFIRKNKYNKSFWDLVKPDNNSHFNFLLFLQG